MTAHTAAVFTRYMMLSIENRESRDERSLGELFYIFPMKCLISHGYRFFNYCQGVNFQSAKAKFMCEFEYLTYISQKQDRETDLKSDRITLGHQ